MTIALENTSLTLATSKAQQEEHCQLSSSDEVSLSSASLSCSTSSTSSTDVSVVTEDDPSIAESSCAPRRKRRHRYLTNNRNRHKSKLNRKTLSIDCEMVGVGEGGYRSALARVVMINWSGAVVMDAYVRPSEPVTDYRTFVSGIHPQDLEQDGVMDLDTCRAKVWDLLKGKILVGHGLENDLEALGITHHWFLTRDTSKWEPFMKMRPFHPQPAAHHLYHHQTISEPSQQVLCPRKLKELCQEKLNRKIQVFGQAHDPLEDAMAALDLYKLVRNKWEEVMYEDLTRYMNHHTSGAPNNPFQLIFYQQLIQFLQKDVDKQPR